MKMVGYRKLLVAVASMLTVVLAQVGLDKEVAQHITDAIVWIAGFYLGGQAVVDVGAPIAAKLGDK